MLLAMPLRRLRPRVSAFGIECGEVVGKKLLCFDKIKKSGVEEQDERENESEEHHAHLRLKTHDPLFAS